jgi:hypothetical protein
MRSEKGQKIELENRKIQAIFLLNSLIVILTNTHPIVEIAALQVSQV